MTEQTTLSKMATDALAERPLHVDPPTPNDRSRAIAAMTAAFRMQRARRRRAVVTSGLFFAAAAAAAIVVGVRHHPSSSKTASVPAAPTTVGVELRDHSGTVTLLHGAEPAAIASTTSIGLDDRVRVGGDGHASIVLSTGTHIDLEPNADATLSIGAHDERVTLNAGAASFHVAKLATGDRFVVHTSDAEVEVRGTKFVVAAGAKCGDRTTTRVVVTEGVVVVRAGGSTTDVPAGSTWPADCSEPTPAIAVETPKQPVSPIKITPTPTTTIAPAVTDEAPTPSSDLAAQNDLFSRALAEKQKGNTAAALADLDALLAQHPTGPLAENAEVERMRLSKGAAAVTAAKAYLAHHPNGFARAEAQAILDAAP